jgi:predicted AAA+ superfamily ATPase
MIERELKSKIENRLGSDKAIIISGARQVGKTTLLESILLGKDDVLWMSGDETATQLIFDDMSAAKFAGLIGNKRYFVLDEAQRIENIGLKLKIIHDAFKKTVQTIATGSSSFDLANKINEPMTGRKWEYKMFPISFREMVQNSGLHSEMSNLHTRLRYGYYPAIVAAPGDEEELLNTIVGDNLYKDTFKWEEIRKPRMFENLLRALAYQIGSEVNVTELATLTGLNRLTVEKYIRLLEQNYIIFRLGSYSRNLRNELKAAEKIYFYDVGVRNALIGDFTPVDIRQDVGHLFENFIIAEFAKKLMSAVVGSFGYFWRTKQQQEIDFITEKNGNITAYEIKWNPKSRVKFPKSFIEKYEPETKVINKDNFYEFV